MQSHARHAVHTPEHTSDSVAASPAPPPPPQILDSIPKDTKKRLWIYLHLDK